VACPNTTDLAHAGGHESRWTVSSHAPLTRSVAQASREFPEGHCPPTRSSTSAVAGTAVSGCTASRKQGTSDNHMKKKIDMRSLNPSDRYKRRIEVIRLHELGLTSMIIASQTGLSRTGVYDICKRYAAKGAASMHDAPPSAESGAARLLEPAQESTARQLIEDNTPDQLSLPYPLWTRAAVARLIDRRFGVHLNVRTLATYLDRWGFSLGSGAGHAGKSASASASAEGNRWLNRKLPAIGAQIRSQGGEICWGSDTRLRGDGPPLPSGDDAGEPTAPVDKETRSLSMTAAVNNRMQMRWSIHAGTLSSTQLINFLRRLVKDSRKKIFLMLQDAPIQRARPVHVWLVEHVDEIEVFDRPRDRL